MKRVVAEESLHYRHGEDIMLALAERHRRAVRHAAGGGEPLVGAGHALLRHRPRRADDPSIHWGVKTRTNEQSRQDWLSQYVPKLWDMGIELPDPRLAWDPTTRSGVDYTEPDWDKLMAIVKGDPTPTTATRLYWRQLLHRHHDWIRDIILGDEPVTAVSAA
jgi:ring-1,2-phenylacetyl-CoA epoxidase subunit PaaA